MESIISRRNNSRSDTKSVKSYFEGAEDFDLGYEGGGGTDILTWAANRFFRPRLFKDRFAAFESMLGDVTDCTISDCGCGTGRYVFEIAKRGAKRVIGIDFSSNMIALGRERLSELKYKSVEFIEGRIEDNFSSCDISILIGVLTYYKNPYELLTLIAKGTKRTIILQFSEGGSTFFTKLLEIMWLLWAKVRKLSVFKHHKDIIVEYMGRYGYLETANKKYGFSWMLRFDKDKDEKFK